MPVRFVLLAAIFLAPTLATGFTSLQHVLARRVRRAAVPWLVLALAAVVVIEALPATARFEVADDPSAAPFPLARTAEAVLMVPLAEAVGTRHEIGRMWRARQAGVPLVNGYSGHESALYRRLRAWQADPPEQPALRGLYALLRRYDVTTIVAEDHVSAFIDRSTLVEEAPSVFRIPDAIGHWRVDRFEMGRGQALVLTASGWSYPERNDRESWVWSIHPRATLQVPLGGVPRRQISLLVRSQSEGDRLELWWNDRRLGVQPVGTTPMLLGFPLPAEVSAADWIDVEVRGPEPVRLRGNPDPRTLSLCVFEIRLE